MENALGHNPLLEGATQPRSPPRFFPNRRDSSSPSAGRGRGHGPQIRPTHAVSICETREGNPAREAKTSETSPSGCLSSCGETRAAEEAGVGGARKRKTRRLPSTPPPVPSKNQDASNDEEPGDRGDGSPSRKPSLVFSPSFRGARPAAVSSSPSAPRLLSPGPSPVSEGCGERYGAKRRKLLSPFGSVWARTRLAFDLPDTLHNAKPSVPPSLACLMAEALADHLFASSAFWASFLGLPSAAEANRSSVRLGGVTSPCTHQQETEEATGGRAEADGPRAGDGDSSQVARDEEDEAPEEPRAAEGKTDREATAGRNLCKTDAQKSCECEGEQGEAKSQRGDDGTGEPSVVTKSLGAFASLSPASVPGSSPASPLCLPATEHTEFSDDRETAETRCLQRHSETHLLAHGAFRAVDSALRAGGRDLFFPAHIAAPCRLSAPAPTSADFEAARSYHQSLAGQLRLLALEFCEQERAQRREREPERDEEAGIGAEGESPPRTCCAGGEMEESRGEPEGTCDAGTRHRGDGKETPEAMEADEPRARSRSSQRMSSPNCGESLSSAVSEGTQNERSTFALFSRHRGSPVPFFEKAETSIKRDLWKRYGGRRRGLYELGVSDDEGDRENLGRPLWNVLFCELDATAWASSLREATDCRDSGSPARPVSSSCLVAGALKLLKAASAHSEAFTVYETCADRGPCEARPRDKGTAVSSPGRVSASGIPEAETGGRPAADREESKEVNSAETRWENAQAAKEPPRQRKQALSAAESDPAAPATPFFLPSPPLLRAALFSLVQRLWPTPQDEAPAALSSFFSALRAWQGTLTATAGAGGDLRDGPRPGDAPVRRSAAFGEEETRPVRSQGEGCAPLRARDVLGSAERRGASGTSEEARRQTRVAVSSADLDVARRALVEEMRACAAVLARVHESVCAVHALCREEEREEWREKPEEGPSPRETPPWGDDAEPAGKWGMTTEGEDDQEPESGAAPANAEPGDGERAEGERARSRGEADSLRVSLAPTDACLRKAPGLGFSAPHRDGASPPSTEGPWGDALLRVEREGEGVGNAGGCETAQGSLDLKLDEAFCRVARDVLLLEALLHLPVGDVSGPGGCPDVGEGERILRQIDRSLQDENEGRAGALECLCANLCFCRDLEESRLRAALRLSRRSEGQPQLQETCGTGQAGEAVGEAADEKENEDGNAGEDAAGGQAAWLHGRVASGEVETPPQRKRGVGGARKAEKVLPQGGAEVREQGAPWATSCLECPLPSSRNENSTPVASSWGWGQANQWAAGRQEGSDEGDKEATDLAEGRPWKAKDQRRSLMLDNAELGGRPREVEDDLEVPRGDSSPRGSGFPGFLDGGAGGRHGGFFDPHWLARYVDCVRGLVQQTARELCIYITFVCEHCLPESHFTAWYAHWVGLRSYHELHAQLARERGELDATLAHLEREWEEARDADGATEGDDWAAECERDGEGFNLTFSQLDRHEERPGRPSPQKPRRLSAVGQRRGRRKGRHVEALERGAEGAQTAHRSGRPNEARRGRHEGASRERRTGRQQEGGGAKRAGTLAARQAFSSSVTTARDARRSKAGCGGSEEKARRRGRHQVPRERREARDVYTVKRETGSEGERDEIEDVPTQTVRTGRPCSISAWVRGRRDRKSRRMHSPEKIASLVWAKPFPECATPRTAAGDSVSASRFSQHAHDDGSPEGNCREKVRASRPREWQMLPGRLSVPTEMASLQTVEAALCLAEAREEGDGAHESGRERRRVCKDENADEAGQAGNSRASRGRGWRASSGDTGRNIKDETHAFEASALAVKKERRLRWTVEETEAFVRGVNEYGVGNWKNISRHYGHLLGGRTNMQLKDKWLNLVKHDHVVEDPLSDTWLLRDTA
ncbi:conserved hypothetical protein [Neospora caninum Liverpool]|uniref:Myb family DNA-binding domain-containing protein n=1 Tax=Neospora caninum (strain Liverpool) TaxID=572307 RepID=F0VB56_NEOCL|nr:conserved hypothetical protein [Neospora caninum Liverpool]CBZ51393.1 conserved hypothetical protein [Neospora caninum Liverpool]CEL68713.1 TPA: Myb family DNA-binding domain-containing protein [Neospora caninum Liverpool]|eukprot:XP_003881426.1 conserved hypothetical protein [Neospora caninum Liverpool]